MLIAQPEVFFELLPKNKVNLLKVIEMTENRRINTEKVFQHLLNSFFPFDAMCWALAELNLIFEKGHKKYSEKDVIERAEEILDSSLDYNTICWFIASFKVYLEEIGDYP